MSGRLKALWLLSLALLRTLLWRLVARRHGLSAFRANYDADALPAVTGEERRRMRTFGRCIACGLCDRGEAERMALSGGAYPGVMGLVLAGSRSIPDYRATAHGLSFVPDEVLAERERICPTAVPLRQMARFVRDKAAQLEGSAAAS